MDYRKIDADLAFALEEVDPADEDSSFSVFVRTNDDADSKAVAVLESLGARSPEPGSRVYTADLSSQGVAELSEQPWVFSLTLSRALRPLRRAL